MSETNRAVARWVLAVSSLLLTCSVASADDWPQWRGPTRDGISKETGLLKEWPKDGPKLLWQVKDLGSGYATPSVVGDRIYLLSNKGLEEESVLALSAKDGSRVWATPLGKVGEPNQQPHYPAARSTPTVDGDSIYALSSDGVLACLDAATGKPRWTKGLREDFGARPGRWAFAESPLVDGDLVLCTPAGPDATVVALEKKNGNVVWKTAVPGVKEANYCSIVIGGVGGEKQYLAMTPAGLVGLDSKSGKLLWTYEKTKGKMGTIPTPVAKGDMVYSASNMTGGGTVKIGAEKATELYFGNNLPTAIGGSVVVGDHLYGCARDLMCVDFKTGKLNWSNPGIGDASLCYADGRLYLHGEKGAVALVEASPQAYKEHGRFTPPDSPKRLNGMEKAWAYPVVANGRLYIRDADCLWCYDVKSSTASASAAQ
jgi:outer membrane protein assembly factor BamB